MNKNKYFLSAVVISLFSLSILWSQSIKLDKNYYKRITSNEAYEIINENKNNPDIIILDVRTDSEFKSGYIKNAKNIDFYAADFKDQINKLDKDKTYLVYCRSGNRSGQTLDIMKNLGFKKVINIGGMSDWLEAGLPVVK